VGVKKIDPGPGAALRAARQEQGLSLRALSVRIGMPFSTLSKLENGKMQMTYDYLSRLAQGLGVDISLLVAGAPPPARPAAVGRRSVARAGQRPDAERHAHAYPAADLSGKLMVPIIVDVTARTVEEMGGLVRHAGEEYLHVLTGRMELHSDLYEPLALNEGDCVYFDSAMAHAYVRVGDGPCRVLSICAGEELGRRCCSQGGSSAPRRSLAPEDRCTRSPASRGW
jgi:transcriptional regulator with XRE-family HTH domain